MSTLLSIVILHCYQINSIISRIQNSEIMSTEQKTELIQVIKDYTSCEPRGN